MGELEQLAREMGDAIRYSMESKIEQIAYLDSSSQITATEYPSGAKHLNYHVDITKVDYYISHLKQLESGVSKEIQKALVPRLKEAHPTDDSQHLVGGVFELADFSEISDLILLHKRIA